MIRSSDTEDKQDENSLDKPAEKLEFTTESINETVEKLDLSTATTIVVDMAGIVQVKSDVLLKNSKET